VFVVFLVDQKYKDSGPAGYEVLWGCYVVLSLHENIKKLRRTHCNCG
jgi:hypothetical protein